MKKIINNKAYDTETAQEVGTWDNGLFPNDFNYCSETLYRKRTGEYFLHGEGGALSAYAIIFGNNAKGGECIRPLDFETARAWAEQSLTAEEYEKYFEVADESRALYVILSSGNYDKLSRAAEREGVSKTEIINRLLSKI